MKYEARVITNYDKILCENCNHFTAPLKLYNNLYTNAVCKVNRCEWEKRNTTEIWNPEIIVKKINEADGSWYYIYREIEEFIKPEEMKLR